MILRSLTLKNIRSYEEETIVFPEGSILLSGDIGCGKTTILLAIEFALFGILKGTVSGAALLRHGAAEGSVELCLGVEGKEVTIRRVLKGGKGIKQEAGFLIVDGIRFDGTAIELKSKILALIGYPDELLTKSKSLIYRYTVYTPQEEMKQILYEPAEDRLMTIRRLFNIDKYVRIRENALSVAKEIKGEKELIIASTERFELLKKEFGEKTVRLEEKRKDDEAIRKRLAVARDLFKEKEEVFKEFEMRLREMEKATRDLSILESSLRNNAENSRLAKEELLEIAQALGAEEPPIVPDIATLKQRMTDKEREVKELQEKLSSLDQKIGEAVGKKRMTEDLVGKVAGLVRCPTCHQEVPDSHKHLMKEKEQENRKKIDDILSELEKRKKELRVQIEEERGRLHALDQEEKEQRILVMKKRTYDELVKKKRLMEERVASLRAQKETYVKEEESVRSRLVNAKDVEEEGKKAKADVETARSGLHALQIEETRIKIEVRNLDEQLFDMGTELARLEGLRARGAKLAEVHHWLTTFFVELVETMEKQVMNKVWTEFSACFQEWFGILIEDETVNVRLADDFSPIIELNGYETFYDNLSGGEKTAVALAYRLGLFKIVNDFIGEVKTKDVIILDEPTDGFSSEQLDRVRSVLEQLQAKQVIIVSHEQKMESFVEHVINVVKEHHVSHVIQH